MYGLAVPREGVFAGASGPAIAFVGVLPVALGAYLRRRFGVKAASEVVGLLFLVGLTITALFAIPNGSIPPRASLLSGRSATPSRCTGPASPPVGSRPAGFLEFGLWSVGLFVTLLGSAFPAAGGMIVNTYVHFLGYALGFLTVILPSPL